GEMPLALARDEVFPAWFARTSAAGIPVRAHLVSSGLVALLLLANSTRSMGDLFKFMALLSTAASLVAYLACSLAALRLQQVGRMERAPSLLVAALLGAVYSAWAIYGAGTEPAVWGAALLLSGVPIYFMMRRNLLRGRTVGTAAVRT
ncbi:amino acid permease, partial [Actinomadura sp. DSM 109109]|nr:amino acid permease [Actinomadura lepetitiana]